MSLKLDTTAPEDWTDDELRWAAQFPWILAEAGLTEDDVEERLGLDGGEDGYQKMKNDDLRVLLVDRGLSVEGKKDELVARLRRDDNDELTDEDQAAD